MQERYILYKPNIEGAAMPATAQADLAMLAAKAAEAARLLRLLAHEKRLLVLCHLAGTGETNVSELAREVGLSQSALSQHLALLREDGLVATRRESQTIWYRLADPKAARLLGVLHELYGPGADGPRPAA
jgi:DNA-binding transcriptional ArsR family regulator